jgi:hypothetical protein
MSFDIRCGGGIETSGGSDPCRNGRMTGLAIVAGKALRSSQSHQRRLTAASLGRSQRRSTRQAPRQGGCLPSQSTCGSGPEARNSRSGTTRPRSTSWPLRSNTGLQPILVSPKLTAATTRFSKPPSTSVRRAATPRSPPVRRRDGTREVVWNLSRTFSARLSSKERADSSAHWPSQVGASAKSAVDWQGRIHNQSMAAHRHETRVMRLLRKAA